MTIAKRTFDVVVVGADRIAANGDVANKIGTYGVACLAAAHGVPFSVVPGVTAARSAGMPVLGFCGGGHWAHDRAGADLLAAGAFRVFDEFTHLPHLLGEWDAASR